MKRFLYLILYPIIAGSIVVLCFFYVGSVFSSAGSETEILSERENLQTESDQANLSEEEAGEFEKMEEFQIHPENRDSQRQEDSEEFSEPERQKPVGLEIPSVGVGGPVEKVGILDNGQMGVPDSAEGIGWFEPGVKPGEQGNAVMAGHVDSHSGPAVFYELKEMEAGDEVHVTDEEGGTLTFKVTKVAKYDRREAPIEDIFGSSEGRHLNLITCTGTFNQEYGTHDDRLVVYTQLVEDESEKQNAQQTERPSSPENVEIRGNRISWHAVDEEEVIGYRVYVEYADGSSEQVDSIATYERKTYISENVGEEKHFITAVSRNGTESSPSEKK
jgi:sortase A